MENIHNLINKVLKDKAIFDKNMPEYSQTKIKITSKNFSDCSEASKEFFSIKDASGWFCDTSKAGIRTFSNNDITIENLGWIIEGEAVSKDGKKSSRISQNSNGGWTIQYFEETDANDGIESITKNASLRQIHGDRLVYQVGYSLENDGKLYPSWQRLLTISLE